MYRKKSIETQGALLHAVRHLTKDSAPFGRHLWIFAAAAVLLMSAPLARTERPLEPLPLPDFSFDFESPTVQSGLVQAGDVLTLGNQQPVTLVPAIFLGLPFPEDDVDGLSAPNFNGPPPRFALLFSVHRLSHGAVPPDPQLIRLNVPYNVLDQAQRGQAAGDEFMSTTLFGPSGRLDGTDSPTANNVLVRNNYDEGGTEFGAVPASSAATNYGSGLRVPQDNVDGFARLPRGPTGLPQQVYFSLTPQSPSLPRLSEPQLPSGANLFVNPDPNVVPPLTHLYAAAEQLGLQLPDNIDAVIVFDLNQSGFFDGNDAVLFSLAPGSPSGGPADVFIVRPGQSPVVFARAAELGLGDSLDNIDGLDLTPCGDAVACAVAHGIRIRRADVNCDMRVDFDDINPFVLALVDPAGYHQQFPDCDIRDGDCNCDGTINFDDINPFVACLAGACGCP